MRLLLFLAVLLSLSACYYLQPMTEPIGHRYYRGQSNGPRDLMILLPGVGDRGSAFDRHGFIQVAQNQAPSLDLVTVEAHFKYYQSRTALQRIRQDIVQPAQQAGYRRIYLAGVSLGGFGSLLYLKEYPAEIAAVLVLAPYIGDEEDYSYLLNGSAVPEPLRDANIWPWITGLSPQQAAKIYLGYGLGDKFVVPNRLLAGYLPSAHTHELAGGHDWRTWTQLWPELIANVFDQGR